MAKVKQKTSAGKRPSTRLLEALAAHPVESPPEGSALGELLALMDEKVQRAKQVQDIARWLAEGHKDAASQKAARLLGEAAEQMLHPSRRPMDRALGLVRQMRATARKMADSHDAGLDLGCEARKGLDWANVFCVASSGRQIKWSVWKLCVLSFLEHHSPTRRQNKWETIAEACKQAGYLVGIESLRRHCSEAKIDGIVL